ncbi:alpha/beta fold hydrolase [Chitinimonas sp.]|uniref:alpha/beta fold hydrolase n=1 Tax=Chitinimonas sp. TaxID=1934313 RepID=UPI0035B0D22E
MNRWVLLRGLIREQRHWGDFPALFSAALDGAGVYTPDLPGNGQRFRKTSPTRIETMVDICRADLAAQSVAPPYGLLALSLGAMVASNWAMRYPQEVGACVLVNTSLRPFSPFWQRLRPANYPALLYRALAGNPAKLEALILQLTSQRADPAVLSSWLGYRQQCPVSTINALRQLLAAARYRAPRVAPPVPCLVVAGERDRLVNPQCSHTLARAWQATLISHPDAGHDLPLDDGLWLAQQIQRWLPGKR